MTLQGPGGNPLGSLQRPDLHQQEQTAASQAVKQTVMAVHDSLEVPLTQLRGANFYKYPVHPDRPLLPMYLQVAMGKKDQSPSEWQEIFEELKNELPENLRALLGRTNAMKDPYLRGLSTALERFAKTLDLARGSPPAISDEERAIREKKVAEHELSFLEQLLRSSSNIIPYMDPGQEKQTLAYLLDRAKKMVPIIISKRKQEQTSRELFLEIERLRKDVFNKFGEKAPSIFLALLDEMEAMNHLSMPDANHQILHTLLHFDAVFGKSEMTLIGPTYRKLAEILLPSNVLFEKELKILITLLLAISFSLLTFGVQRGQIADTLSLCLFLSEKILLGAGSALFEGTFLPPLAAHHLGEDLLGTLIGLFLSDTYPEEEESILNILEKPLTKLLQNILKRHTGAEEPYLQRALYALEGKRGQELFIMAKDGFSTLKLKEEIWMRDLHALQVFYEFVNQALEGERKGGGEMTLFAQPA